MSEPMSHPAVQRILRNEAHAQAFAVLAEQLSGADLTSMLLGVFDVRSSQVTCADVLRQHQQDRFVAPGPVDALSLARIELQALEAAATEFETMVLAPLAPLGAHRALGGTPQNNVVSTARSTEVTADPTNSLALEAATLRSQLLATNTKSMQTVQLAAVHRVTRAQRFGGPRSFAHFSLLGLVSAGRDAGNYRFELDRMIAQIDVLIRLVRSCTTAPIEVQLTPFVQAVAAQCESRCAERSAPGESWTIWRDREHGRGYYRSMCFKLNVDIDGDRFELGDGGDVWWTQELLANRKERLVIGGLGLERLAMLVSEYGTSAQVAEQTR